MTRRRWTPAETAALIRMVEEEHMPDQDIATALGRSLPSVVGKRTALGIEGARIRGRPRLHDWRRIMALVEEGMPQAAAARVVGCSTETVRRVMGT